MATSATKPGFALLTVRFELVGEDHGVVIDQLFVVGRTGEGPKIEMGDQMEAVLISPTQPVLVLEGALEHYPHVRKLSAPCGQSVRDKAVHRRVKVDAVSGVDDA